MLSPIFDFYQQSPLAALALFWIAHLAASMSGFPGGCTALNVGAGAVMGFTAACAAIYPVTMLSAVLMYTAGRRLGGARWTEGLRARAQAWLGRLRGADLAVLVLLRLNPLLPFNVINFAGGLTGIPFRIFLLSTFVGVFFDVVLLSSIGAAMLSSSWIGGAFAVLAVAAYLWRLRWAPEDGIR